ncbi:MAG TPA: condensation domain-containing protein [Anaerolineae bacterium]|nr:condensation domain-containing protein [Anaerolineae bacterium]
MSKLSQIITTLSPEQRALLELQLKKKRVNGSRLEKISRRPNPDTFPLSFAQQRLWFLDQLNPGTAIYNLHEAIRLRGPLAVGTLEQSLNEILWRHETLRATFANVAGQPMQRISGAESFSLALIDLQELSELEREIEAQRLANQEAQRPFDLAQDPLLRATLVRLDQEDYVFLLTMHHIIADGWSMGLFKRELGALYQAFLKGQPSPLPELPIQYADFAHWQHQRLQSEALANQLTYWKQHLAGQVPMLQLPTDYPQPPIQTYQGSYQSLVLSEELTEALKKLSRQEGVTLFVTLLTAFMTLLNRFTEQEDLVICSPIAGRKQIELEDLIGYFNNIVVLRTDLSGNPSFRELLARSRQVILGAYDHQDLPFQTVADLPNLTLTPLSRALFDLRDASDWPLELPGITVNSLEVNSVTTYFDLSFDLQEKAKKLSGVLGYKTDLFSPTTIAQMLSHFQILLESLIAEPEQRLSALPCLTKSPQRLDPLPRSATDQANHHLLSAPNSARHEPTQTFVAPRDDLELRLTKIWEQVLGLRPIGVRDNFFQLGGHSLLALRLFTQVEKVMHKHLPLATLFQAPTIEQLATLLRNEGWSAPWSSLVPIQTAGSRPPFFCVHAHGGNVLGYYDLAQHLGPDQPFYGLQAQGLNRAQAGIPRFADMAAHYIREIRTIQPHGPYFLGGYCFGGDVAFEMAQQLQTQGEEVGLLVMMQNPRPDYPRLLPTTTLFHRLAYQVMTRVDLEWSNFSEVDPEAKLAYSLERINRLIKRGQVKAEKILTSILAKVHLNIEHSRAYALETLGEIHDKAYEAYKPRPYRGRVVLFRAGKQPLGICPDPTLGWGELIEGELELQEVPGHRIGLLSEPRVRVLAEHLTGYLVKAQKQTAGGSTQLRLVNRTLSE